jgi:hypothetical protein
MTFDAWLLVASVLTLTAWMVIHIALLYGVLRDASIESQQKAWAFVPLLTPVIAWRAGMRIAPVLWLASALLHALLRAMEE